MAIHAGKLLPDLVDLEPVDFSEQIARLARLAQHLLGADGAAISLVDSHGERILAGVGSLAAAASNGQLLGHLAKGEAPLVIEGVAEDTRFAGFALPQPAPRFYAGAASPLPRGQGRAVVWALGATGSVDVQLAGMLADCAKLAATGITFRAQVAASQEVGRRAVVTSRLLAGLGAADRYETAFAAALRVLCETYSAATGRIWRLEPVEGVLREVCHYAATPELGRRHFTEQPQDLSPQNSIIARAMLANQPYTAVLADLARETGNKRVEALVRQGMVCHIIQPIHHESEHLAVGLMFDTPRPDLDEVAADIASHLEVIRTALYRKVVEERMRLLTAALDHSNDGVVITRASTTAEPGKTIVYANASFCRTHGYELSEVLGQSSRMMFGPDADIAVVDRMQTTLARGEPVREELLLLRKDGSHYWTEVDALAMDSDVVGPGHQVAMQRDITQRKSAELAALQAQKMQAIGQITGGVAHDFNNLLAIISGNLELLEEALEGQPDLLDGVRAALGATARGATLTRSLLAFARQQPLEPRAVKMNDLARDMTELLRRTLPGSIDIRLVPADGLWTCEADPAQLENALLNLALNARDAMPGGGRLTIETENRVLDESHAAAKADLAPGDYVMLAVSDTGSGMSPEVIVHAFEPFFTTKAVDRGTGLGLSMVYGFLKQSRGHVNIYSEFGQGTTVRLYLPRHRGSKGTEAQAAADTAPPVRGTASVLVVEDNPDVRRLTCVLLHSLGYRVLEAEDGETALAVLRGADEIAVLLTDVVLPGSRNGVLLANEAVLLRPGLRVLYMSGYTENAIMHHGRVDPGIRLLQKPFRRQELADKMRAVLDDAAG